MPSIDNLNSINIVAAQRVKNQSFEGIPASHGVNEFISGCALLASADEKIQIKLTS
jgi:hypothetical protein